MIPELAHLSTSPLAMTSEAASGLLDDLRTMNPGALEAYRPFKHDEGQRLGRRGDTAVLYAIGPLFKRENWITKILGFTTYETLRQDLQVALDDPGIKSIVLNVDSPGGEANGCDELATAIYEARGRKPTHAYVSGMACSGGYWLASATEKITVSEASIVGSIGVVLSLNDRSKADAARGIARRDFVSSNAPGKRPNISTDQGQATVQKMVDTLGDVFVNAVARHRGVAASTVVNKFGQGGVHIGSDAVKAGMVDAVGQFEAVLKNLASGSSTASFKPIARASVAAPTLPAPIRISAADLAAQRASERIQAILASAPGKANPARAKHYAFNTTLPVPEALEAIQRENIAATWKGAIALVQHDTEGLTYDQY